LSIRCVILCFISALVSCAVIHNEKKLLKEQKRCWMIQQTLSEKIIVKI
jgi:hypothetical protein